MLLWQQRRSLSCSKIDHRHEVWGCKAGNDCCYGNRGQFSVAGQMVTKSPDLMSKSQYVRKQKHIKFPVKVAPPNTRVLPVHRKEGCGLAKHMFLSMLAS